MTTLDNLSDFLYNTQANGVWRSLVSRLVRVQEASGSNPDTPTKIKRAAEAALFILVGAGSAEGDRHEVTVNNMPLACYLARGRIFWFLDAPIVGVDRNQICLMLEII